MNTQNRFYPRIATPWGAIQHYHRIADGVISVSTAGHGGIWLSDERIKELPDDYESCTGTPRWNEEDEDGALVLQYLGLLSLIPEPLELHITQADIDKGRETRKTLYGENWFKRLQSPRKQYSSDSGHYGGAIVEAYKRQTRETREMICYYHLCPKPGGYQLAKLCDAAQAFMKRFDAGEAVEPATFVLEPYKVYERVPFSLHTATGEVHVSSVNGRTAKRILEGDKEELDFYLQFYAGKKTVKITHEDTVVWQRQ